MRHSLADGTISQATRRDVSYLAVRRSHASHLTVSRKASWERHMTKNLVSADDVIVEEKTIVRLLEDDGYQNQVMSVDDGRRGIALFRSAQPDLVVSDVIMPEQEGIQTISEMQKAEPDAKIIVMSAGGHMGNADFLKIALALGAIDAIPKPFNPDKLSTIVKGCLAGRPNSACPQQAA
jgi:DNA-binding NtrC family response regulator